MSQATTRNLPFDVSELPLVDVDCRLCGSTESDTIIDATPFKVLRCHSCEFVYVTPRVPDNQLHRVYEGNYFESGTAEDYGYSDYLREGQGHSRTFGRKAAAMKLDQRTGRLLEVGCAGGFFLDIARNMGYEVEGIEISKSAVDFAKNRLDIPSIHQGCLEDVNVKKNHYDVIALWDVIEHLADPFATLRRLRTFLKEDGVLVMQTQDVNSWAAKLLGRRWHHYKHLEHIYHFSPKTMRRALNEAGFEIIELTQKGAGKYISFDFLVDRMRRFNGLLHFLCLPLKVLGRFYFYLNPLDEFIVMARPKLREPKKAEH